MKNNNQKHRNIEFIPSARKDYFNLPKPVYLQVTRALVKLRSGRSDRSVVSHRKDAYKKMRRVVAHLRD